MNGNKYKNKPNIDKNAIIIIIIILFYFILFFFIYIKFIS